MNATGDSAASMLSSICAAYCVDTAARVTPSGSTSGSPVARNSSSTSARHPCTVCCARPSSCIGSVGACSSAEKICNMALGERQRCTPAT